MSCLTVMFVYDDHFIHMFDINSVQTKLFNLGTHDNPKNILIASDLTPEEREKNERCTAKKTESICLGLRGHAWN